MAITIDELKELIQTDEHRQLELRESLGIGALIHDRMPWDKLATTNV